MANIKTPPQFVPMNMPMECIGNQNGITSCTVQVFCSSTLTDQGPKVFEGKLTKKPNATYFGFDAQPYVIMQHMPVFSPDPCDGLVGVCPFTRVDVKMVTDSSVLVYASNHYAIPTNLEFDNFSLWEQGTPHGDFKMAIANGIKFSNGTQYDDYIPSRMLYTYNKVGTTPNSRVWNTSLKGAPRPIGFISLDASNGPLWDVDEGVTVYVSRYSSKDALKADASTYINGPGFNGITGDDNIFGMPTLLLQFNQPSLLEQDAQYISYVVELLSVIVDNQREIFIEQQDPSCFKMTPYQLYWLNRKGGYDWLIMEGKSTKTRTTERQTLKGYDRVFNGVRYEGDSKTLGKTNPTSDYWGYGDFAYNWSPKSLQWIAEEQVEWQLNSRHLTDWEWERVQDLLSSPVVFIWDSKSKQTKAVELTTSSIQEKNFSNDRMSSLAVTVRTINKERIL